MWETLRARAEERPDWQAAWAFFAALLARVDYVSPHALFAEALGPLGGRARLFARLGPEAAEPVDELLNAALAYSRMHPPSLQGFLHWLRRSGAEVKREAEGAGSLVRVMTVHGAKGLQAPLVILPDTTAAAARGRHDPVGDRSGHRPRACRSGRRGANCAAPPPSACAMRPTRRRMEEHNRLLYVALTRAEDRLVVCGWQTRRALDDACWYRLVERGFDALPADVRSRTGRRSRRHATPQRREARAPAMPSASPRDTELPRLGRPRAGLARRRATAEPGPAGAAGAQPAGECGARPGAGRRLAAGGARGGDQPLPARQADPRAAAASARSAARATAPTPPAPGWIGPATICQPARPRSWRDEMLAILDHPELAPLFGPGSRAEVPLTGVVNGAVVGGLVDRLAVLADRVLIADYKTNRRPPARIEDTPVLYLRQMAAYRAVLRDIFPGRGIVCALVWTQASQVVMLPDELLESHTPSHARRAA